MKSKKELQAENSALKEELSYIKVKFTTLSEKYDVLQKQSNQQNGKGVLNLKCDVCDLEFRNASELRKHENLHKGAVKFSCSVCCQEFDEEWKMEVHAKKHTKLTCDQCGKQFKYLDTMEKHIKIVHDKCKLYCHYFNNRKTCPFDKECVFLHEDADNCKYGESCERLLCMFKHESVICLDAEDDNISDKTVQTIIVDVHEDEIVTVDSVIETNVSEELDVIETIDNAISGREYSNPSVYNLLAFKCKMCDFASARKTELKNHKKTIHHWCFICFSSYTCQQNLKDHFLDAHSKNPEDLELALGEAPR